MSANRAAFAAVMLRRVGWSRWLLVFTMACLAPLPAARNWSPELGPVRDTVTLPAPDSLAAVWTGTYAGGTYGRSGTLEIRLHDSARAAGRAGDIVLGGVPPDGRDATFATAADRAAFPKVSTPVRGVEVRGTRVTMWADPYLDTGCGCTIALNFEGQLVGDTITGRYTAAGSPTMVAETDGRWRVVRSSPLTALAARAPLVSAPARGGRYCPGRQVVIVRSVSAFPGSDHAGSGRDEERAMLSYIAARDSLIQELLRDAAAHEAERYDEVGRRFDRMERELPRGGAPELTKLHIALVFWDAWIDARNRGWPLLCTIARAEWPLLARGIASDLTGDREISDARVGAQFDVSGHGSIANRAQTLGGRLRAS
ncbi:MAG: hypothetical protein ACREON_17365 [Gemmatimonadaceae bacterium]